MWLLECEGELFDNKRVWLRPGKSYLFGRTKADPSADDTEQRKRAPLPYNQRNTERLSKLEQAATGFQTRLFLENILWSQWTCPFPEMGQSHVHKKSKLTITDYSKTGTTLDGEKFSKESRVLNKLEHTIKLGSFAQALKIKWQPVVLTFSYSAKELKDGRDPLRPIRAKVEALDIKVVLTYINGQTSHAVAAKRNTAKGLQALINGKYIVTEAYVDALVAAATSPSSAEDVENALPSPLEEDYNRNWPRAREYLPEAGREPHPRPAELFEPNPERANIFAGFMFVFSDESQYNNLADVINNGAGKAVKYDLEQGQTTPQELVQFVRNLAGEKYAVGDSVEGDSGIVLVAFKPRRDWEEEAMHFRYKVALELKQAWVEQNELLDVILLCDTSGLRKPFTEADLEALGASSGNAEPAAVATEQSRVTAQAVDPQAQQLTPAPLPTGHQRDLPESAPEPLRPAEVSSQPQLPDTEAQPETFQPPPVRRRGRRVITTSRFKGFDAFDPSQLSKSHTIPEDDVEHEPSQRMDVDSQSLFVGGSQGLRSQQAQKDQQQPSRKRRTPPLSPSPDVEDMVEGLLPAAAAMKRRRLEEEQSGNRSFSKPFSAPADDEVVERGKGKRKEKKKIDYLEVARERREAEEEAARKDQESMMQAMDGLDVEQMRNLAIVETFDIQVRTDRPRKLRDGKAVEASVDERWDSRWNGRKNFKKFRRKGEGGGQAPNRGPRVIVGLEEVKKKDFGIGEDYWLESSSKTKKKKNGRESGSQAATGHGHSQSQQLPRGTMASTATVRGDGDDEDDEDTVLPEEIVRRPRDEDLAEKAAEEGRRTGQRGGRVARGQGGDTETQTQTQTQTQKSTGLKTATLGKRPASGEAVGGRAAPPAKRPAFAAVGRGRGRGREESEDEDSDEEDELKFRFRRRK